MRNGEERGPSCRVGQCQPQAVRESASNPRVDVSQRVEIGEAAVWQHLRRKDDERVNESIRIVEHEDGIRGQHDTADAEQQEHETAGRSAPRGAVVLAPGRSTKNHESGRTTRDRANGAEVQRNTAALPNRAPAAKSRPRPGRAEPVMTAPPASASASAGPQM